LCLSLGAIFQLFPLISRVAVAESVPVTNAAPGDQASQIPGRLDLPVIRFLEAVPSPIDTPTPNEADAASNDSDLLRVDTTTVAIGGSVTAIRPCRVEPYLTKHGEYLAETLRLALEAYLIFDPDGTGFIDRDTVRMCASEESADSSLLSREQWLALEIDAGDRIQLRDFLCALIKRAGVVDDRDDDLNVPRSIPRPGAERVSAVVIGGGVAGCAAALELADRGYRVTLLEKNTIGSGASSTNPGRMGHGFHYVDVKTAVMYLHNSSEWKVFYFDVCASVA
jgi:hypothetical protein